MSSWYEAVREVYNAGGELMPCKILAMPEAIGYARKLGYLEKWNGGKKVSPIRITQLGIDLVESRITLRTPFVPNGGKGRAPDTHRRIVATWLSALPRTNEVRI